MKCEVFLSKNTDDWATPKFIYDADGNGYPTRIYNDSPKIAILF